MYYFLIIVIYPHEMQHFQKGSEQVNLGTLSRWKCMLMK